MSEKSKYQFNELNKPKGNPFEVDKGYFNDLDNRLMQLTEEEPSLDLSNKTPFSVDSEYFDQLENKVLAINKTESSNSPTWYIAIAASLALLFGLGSIFNTAPDSNLTQTKNQSGIKSEAESESMFKEVSNSDLLAYVEINYMDEMDAQDLGDLMDEETIEELEIIEEYIEPVVETQPEENLNLIIDADEESIEDYLEENYNTDDLIEVY